MKRRVILRADAGSSIGFGHFIRTSALASYLRDDFECVIASHNPDGTLTPYQLEVIEQCGASAQPLCAASIDTANEVFLQNIDKNDIVVLDNYYYATSYQQKIKEKARALVCIDDVHDRHFVADVVMTFCPLERNDFSLEPYTRFFGGIEWAFLREPFFQKSAGSTRKFPGRKMVIAMGGADPFRLTDKMVGVVRNVFPDVEICVIAGQTVEVSRIDDDKISIYRKLSAGQIVELFDSADWGLFPASTICVEAFARNLPVVAGHYVDNQHEFYEHGVANGWFAPLGNLTADENSLRKQLESFNPGMIAAARPDFDFRARREEIVDIFKSL